MFNLGYTGHRTTKGLIVLLFYRQLGQFFILSCFFFDSSYCFPIFVLGSLGFDFLHGAAYKEDW
jgi:hypothetical protein